MHTAFGNALEHHTKPNNQKDSKNGLHPLNLSTKTIFVVLYNHNSGVFEVRWEMILQKCLCSAEFLLLESQKYLGGQLITYMIIGIARSHAAFIKFCRGFVDVGIITFTLPKFFDKAFADPNLTTLGRVKGLCSCTSQTIVFFKFLRGKLGAENSKKWNIGCLRRIHDGKSPRTAPCMLLR